MTASTEADDWETLLDSGQLDANIKKMTILQRPKTATQPNSNGGQNATVNIVCSDDPMSQYRSTEPVIKIMKRPGSAQTQNSASNNKPKMEQKSLKQREQEYAEARQRILGSVGSETSQEPSRSSPVKTVQPGMPPGVPPPPVRNPHSNGVSHTRHPRGPPSEGGRGFIHQPR